ncbi:hypothetical protein [uncultured Bradyrhizobium sp.]|uniref:Uncharacterized protein n=1 Tax=Candidatus Afipia apatlaquensis TaxID=2712852 RepID=A0A7C9VEJ5_9BRAD|nr:hypothetical protein [uncultured Bradyrhizobium sp.]NGX96368.1 hypothetical protein [Candidatus Afipia apatlaquensis]
MTYQRNETPEPLAATRPDTDYPLLRLRVTTPGNARLEMGAVVAGVLQWQDVPIVQPTDVLG